LKKVVSHWNEVVSFEKSGIALDKKFFLLFWPGSQKIVMLSGFPIVLYHF